MCTKVAVRGCARALRRSHDQHGPGRRSLRPRCRGGRGGRGGDDQPGATGSAAQACRVRMRPDASLRCSRELRKTAGRSSPASSRPRASSGSSWCADALRQRHMQCLFASLSPFCCDADAHAVTCCRIRLTSSSRTRCRRLLVRTCRRVAASGQSGPVRVARLRARLTAFRHRRRGDGHRPRP